jgi:uncharacterized protein (DUF1684 family)
MNTSRHIWVKMAQMNKSALLGSGLRRGLERIAWASLCLVSACSSGPPPPATSGSAYTERVEQTRASKDEAFRVSADSPIPEAQRATFKGLAYFPIDASYSVPASLAEERSADPVIIELATSRNTVDRLARVGTITFRLAGTRYTLTAFATAADGLNRLFVPFGDLTNRQETYGGGRYLNLTRTATGLYDLDFNTAFNPYCVYDVNYTCPLPPPENRLPVAIPAGERMPEAYR